jgi:hypothetical protein
VNAGLNDIVNSLDKITSFSVEEFPSTVVLTFISVVFFFFFWGGGGYALEVGENIRNISCYMGMFP